MISAAKFVSVIILILMSSFSKTINEEEHAAKWKLVWQDEFNYSGLPDPKKWSYETGHVRNEEKQFYTAARKDNVCALNGKLIITGRKENFPNEFYKKGNNDWRYENEFAHYTSASIHTKKYEGWKYGKIEVRAKLPTGKGMWPAIWMMGTNHDSAGWPVCGEIDIMEFVGSDPEYVHGSLHFFDPKIEYRSGGSKISNTSADTFHTYAVEWDKIKINFCRDGVIYHSFPIDEAGTGIENPFRKPFYLKINLAMGATWPGPIDDKILPQKFIIDYVRVYKKTNAAK